MAIKLKRGNLVMEVGTEVQASAFIKAGYEVVKDEPKTPRRTAPKKANATEKE